MESIDYFDENKECHRWLIARFEKEEDDKKRMEEMSEFDEEEDDDYRR